MKIRRGGQPTEEDLSAPPVLSQAVMQAVRHDTERAVEEEIGAARGRFDMDEEGTRLLFAPRPPAKAKPVGYEEGLRPEVPVPTEWEREAAEGARSISLPPIRRHHPLAARNAAGQRKRVMAGPNYC